MIFAGHTTSPLPFQRQGSLWKMGAESLLEVSTQSIGCWWDPEFSSAAPHIYFQHVPPVTAPWHMPTPPPPRPTRKFAALVSSVIGPPLTFWVSLSVHPPPDWETGHRLVSLCCAEAIKTRPDGILTQGRKLKIKGLSAFQLITYENKCIRFLHSLGFFIYAMGR